jgi:HEAT repeat protein
MPRPVGGFEWGLNGLEGAVEASDGNPLARISAFQVSALQGDRRALPRAVEAARNGGIIPLRVSAIAALGTLGGAEEIALLKGILEERNPSVRTAAGEALQRLVRRTEG